MEIPLGIMGHFKVGHVNAHQKNPLSGLGGDVTTKWTFWYTPFKWPPGGLQQCRDGLNLDIILLYPLRHKLPTRTVLSANRRDRGCRWLWGRLPRGEGPTTHSQQVDYTGLMPAALVRGAINGSYQE